MQITELDRIADKINQEFQVNIFKHTRARDVVDARSIFCYIARDRYNMSLNNIADYFRRNGKPYDHSTAVHAIKQFETVIKFNPRAEYVMSIILKDTDEDAHSKFLVEEILTKADKETKKRVNRILNTVYNRTLEQKKAAV